MNKVIHGIVAALFAITCLFQSWMLTLVSGLMPGVQMPAITRVCVSSRPVLWVLAALAVGYCVYVWFSKRDTRNSWVGFFAGTMMVLVFVMVPTMITAWLPVLHLTSVLASR
jgi:hypothetical protein